jgi:hypothetical protein
LSDITLIKSINCYETHVLTLLTGFAQAQVPQISGIRSAAPFLPAIGNVTHGDSISIYGSNFTIRATLTPFPPSAPLTFSGTTVTIGGLSAPLLFISPTQRASAV